MIWLNKDVIVVTVSIYDEYNDIKSNACDIIIIIFERSSWKCVVNFHILTYVIKPPIHCVIRNDIVVRLKIKFLKQLSVYNLNSYITDFTYLKLRIAVHF